MSLRSDSRRISAMRLTPEEPNNVIAINGVVAEQLEIERKANSGKFKCIGVHKNVLIDTEQRTLSCKACGFAVDAFDYLDQWAREGDSRMTGLKNIEVRRKIAQQEHNDLMQKIKNLRQRLKRAGEPQPPKERFEYDQRRWNIK